MADSIKFAHPFFQLIDLRIFFHDGRHSSILQLLDNLTELLILLNELISLFMRRAILLYVTLEKLLSKIVHLSLLFIEL